ncbi:MAG: hypothetical protein LC776_18565 [Acidobacteria bacterium]|nr:hypothetical protein [Acidobacteriota bacterium]
MEPSTDQATKTDEAILRHLRPGDAVLEIRELPSAIRTPPLSASEAVERRNESEEEPGKIVHEWRDLADPVAQRITAESGWGWPYYGAVDTTPLFIRETVRSCDAEPSVLADEVVRLDGQRCSLANSLARAVSWICARIDDDPDGLLTYQRMNPKGIENQTWRDSWDSLSHADGSLPNWKKPIAALDVQVLAYEALIAAARIFRLGMLRSWQTPEELVERADRIRDSMFRRFWVDDGNDGFFAAALDFSESGVRRALRTKISDMGQMLASSLLIGNSPKIRECRENVVRRLFSPGLLCSAGIRSLHADEARCWPGGYHTGSSWLWQTMQIADGLERHDMHLLAQELRRRCWRVHMGTGLLPEFARGADDRRILNDRIVDIWQSDDQRRNRIEQPPQEVQAWTVASMYAAKRKYFLASRLPSPDPSVFEEEIAKNAYLRVTGR